jgi:hypothetical protein
MATLTPTRNEWQQKTGESFDAYMQRLDEILKQTQFPVKGEPIVGRLLRFPVFDNYAFYVIASEAPFSIEHFPYGDGYTIAAAWVRGLEVSDLFNS